MVGVVITKPLLYIEAGSIGVLNIEDSEYHLATASHIDLKGEWVYESGTFKGILPVNYQFCKLYINAGNQGTLPLKFTQWKNAIKGGEVNNIDNKVAFIKVPLKFAKGHYMRECMYCHSDFMASKSQHVCITCCNEKSIAKIVKFKPKAKMFVKDKRPRMISPMRCEEIANQARSFGEAGMSTDAFKEWLKKQL